MNPENEHIRQLVLMVLRSSFAKSAAAVIEVPEGVAVLSTDGRHALIRIDSARLEAAS